MTSFGARNPDANQNRPYDPAPKVLAPAIPWDQAPLVCISMSAIWFSHIGGIIERLDQPDAFTGTDAQIEYAREQVRNILASVSECIPMAEIQLLQDGCELVVMLNGQEEDRLLLDLTNCVLNDPVIIQEITNISNSPASSGTAVTPGSSRSGATAIGGNECDPNTIWGQVGKLVDYIHTNNVDFFENLNLIAAASDRIEAWLDIVPVLGDIVEAVVNTVTETGDALLSSYNASYNDSLRDSIACELFCLALGADGCRLTIQDVIDLLLEKYNLSSALPSLVTPSAAATFLRMGQVIAQGGGIAYSGDDMVYISFLVQLVAVSTTDQWFNLNSVGNYYNEMHDSVPSPGWETECDECPQPPWSITWDFTNGDTLGTAWQMVASGGAGPFETYVPELSGWCRSDGTAEVIRFNLLGTWELTSVTMTGRWVATRSSDPEALLAIFDDGALIASYQHGSTGAGSSVVSHSWSAGQMIDGLQLHGSAAGNGCDAEFFVETIVLTGVGPQPAGPNSV